MTNWHWTYDSNSGPYLVNRINHHEIWPEDVASDADILDKTDEYLDQVWSTIMANKEEAAEEAGLEK